MDIEKLKASIENDKRAIAKKQVALAEKVTKLKKLEDSVLVLKIKTLTAKGKDINELIQAIENNDIDAIKKFIPKSETRTERNGHKDE